MSSIIIPGNMLSCAGVSDPDIAIEAVFLSVYLRFKANAFGQCVTSFEELSRILGHKSTANNATWCKRQVLKVLTAISNSPEADGIHGLISLSLPDNLEATRTKTGFTLLVTPHSQYFGSGTYLNIQADTFQGIIEAALRSNISPAELFSYYSSICLRMYPIDYGTGQRTRGCWRYSQSICQCSRISLVTYRKYRQILHDSNLMYFRPGKGRGSPVMFSLTNDTAVWAVIEEQMHRRELVG